MWSTARKRAAWACLVAIALASCGTRGGEGPVFATAEPVAAAKPENFGFRQAIRVEALEGLTETVRRNFSTVLHADDFADSLRRSLANDQMLAPEGADAAYELTPYFVDLRTAPVNDRVTAAQAIFQYRVVRLADNTLIFNRRVKAEFSSVADPAFEQAGFFGRTLRLVGLRKDEPKPSGESPAASGEKQGPGPEGETAREVHAARNAIALNLRTAVRHLIVASPERIVAPQTDAMPQDEAAGGTRPHTQDAPAADDDPELGSDPLPPIAPPQDGPGETQD